MLICVICEKPSSHLNRVYSLPAALHDCRVMCERVSVSSPAPGNYAHPSCVNALKQRLTKRATRQVIQTTWRGSI